MLYRVFKSVSKESEQTRITEYRWRSIRKELVKEIAEMKPLEIKSLKSKLDEKLECKIGQISFDVTDFFNQIIM